MAQQDECHSPRQRCPFDSASAAERIAVLETKVQQLERSIVAIDGRLEHMNSTLDAIRDQVSKVHGGWWVLAGVGSAGLAILGLFKSGFSVVFK